MLGATDYTLFKPMETELLHAARRLAGHHHNLTAKILLESDDEEIQGLLQYLKSKGIKRVSEHWAGGTQALLIELNDHQIMRISRKRQEKNRSTHPIVLQPLFSEIHGRYRLEFLPEVHTLEEICAKDELAKKYGLSEDPESRKRQAGQFLKQISVDCLHEGMVFNDISVGNVALIKNGSGMNVPVVLDADAVSPLFIRSTVVSDADAFFAPNQSQDFPKTIGDFQHSEAGGIEMLKSLYINQPPDFMYWFMEKHFHGETRMEDYKELIGTLLERLEERVNNPELPNPLEVMSSGERNYLRMALSEAYDYMKDLNKKPKRDNCRTYYREAQEQLLNSLGLKRGFLKGIFSPQKLQRLTEAFDRERPSGVSSVGHLTTDAWAKGVSPSEFAAAIGEACNKHFMANEQGFLDNISDKAQRMGMHRPGLCHRVSDILTRRGAYVRPPASRE